MSPANARACRANTPRAWAHATDEGAPFALEAHTTAMWCRGPACKGGYSQGPHTYQGQAHPTSGGGAIVLRESSWPNHAACPKWYTTECTRAQQGQPKVPWGSGKCNKGDSHTKHHPLAYHRQVGPTHTCTGGRPPGSLQGCARAMGGPQGGGANPIGGLAPTRASHPPVAVMSSHGAPRHSISITLICGRAQPCWCATQGARGGGAAGPASPHAGPPPFCLTCHQMLPCNWPCPQGAWGCGRGNWRTTVAWLKLAKATHKRARVGKGKAMAALLETKSPNPRGLPSAELMMVALLPPWGMQEHLSGTTS